MVAEDRQPVPDEPDVDLTRPNAARMYDYYLGGDAHFAADREAADRALARFPHAAGSARANRAFLDRAVRACLQKGIRQFLDLGSGVPTVGNVHEIAHHHDPEARVAYVDNEPVAVAHGDRLMAENPLVTVTLADLRNPREVLAAPGVAGLLDFRQPVAVLMVAVLHFVSDEADPTGIVATYREALPAGSALVLSHISDDQPTEELAAPHRAVAEVYRTSSTPAHLRDYPAIAALFTGFEVLAPGVVDARHWRPDEPRALEQDPCGFYAGVGWLPRPSA
ncbi:SAM-dependent methyltransferase [Haloactinomyces albus]|uniref:Ribosome-associated RNA-binding protein Tma20 n=1 Tax=Haloactinomyces albus TaxID=1352928 RepID=A0AAE3ZIP4_9ACTN|nr:SAM-dependent methyltransferase [Haloactinomyces albus]MDR7304294.1 putative ribosome-associated RNA-binding protein Tma20 [Haloactinomyces albus]